MGDRFFSQERPVKEHLVRRGGVSGEVADLRSDLLSAFQRLQDELDGKTSIEYHTTQPPLSTATQQTPTFTKVNGTYENGILQGFTQALGVATYTGSVTKVFRVDAKMSVDASLADEYEFDIAKNGTQLGESSGQHRRIANNDIGMISLGTHVELANGETIEIQCARQGGVAANLIFEHLIVMIEEIRRA
jgi:hypothetical protein